MRTRELYDDEDDSFEFARDGGIHSQFKDGDIEMDRNMNVFDNGYGGKASMYAQKDKDTRNSKIARNLGTTMRQSKNNYLNNLDESVRMAIKKVLNSK